MDYIGFGLFVIFFGFLDTYTTIKGMKISHDFEQNPIIRSVVKISGFSGFVCLKSILIVFGYYVLTDFRFIVLISGVVACNNIYQLKLKRV